MLKRAIIGFAVGAAAVVVFHQSMVLLLHLMGYTPNFPWSFRPVGPLGVPALVNQMFWGGLWGIGFAFMASRIPVGNWLARGALFGWLGPFVLGNGFLVPLFRRTDFLFSFPAQRWIIGSLIAIAFGLGLAVLGRLAAKLR
jgi:hypothetical protein